MAYSRRSRERRLRAQYRKKTAITGVVMLLLGIIAGFVLCVFSVNHPGPMSNFLKIGPISNVTVTPVDESRLAINEPDDNASIIGSLTAQENNEAVDPANDVIDSSAAGEVSGINSILGGNNADAENSSNNIEPLNAATAAPEVQAIAAITEKPVEATEEPAVEEPTEAPVEADPEAEEPAEAAEVAIPEAEEPVETEAPEEPVDAENETPAEAGEEVAAESTPEVTPEPTPEATPETLEPVIVPYGEAYMLETQIKADGSERSTVDDEPYETLSLTLKVDAYKDPAYFQSQYSTQYKLQGDEAAVEFDITLNGYTGTTEIIPQNFLLITFVGSDPSVTTQGYQLMDAEIGGKTEVAISSDVPSKLYKRYPYSAEQGDMVYMVVTTYNDGVQGVYWFEILAPEPEETPEPETPEENADEASGEAASDGTGLTVGSQGDDVIKLQRALIDKGLLTGNPDGKFGNYTAGAVKEMQRRYGMEQTGIADQAFLDRLYADQ